MYCRQRIKGGDDTSLLLDEIGNCKRNKDKIPSARYVANVNISSSAYVTILDCTIVTRLHSIELIL